MWDSNLRRVGLDHITNAEHVEFANSVGVDPHVAAKVGQSGPHGETLAFGTSRLNIRREDSPCVYICCQSNTGVGPCSNLQGG